MKLTILPFAAFALSFVIPDAELTNEIAIQTQEDQAPKADFSGNFPKNGFVREFGKSVEKLLDTSKDTLDSTLDTSKSVLDDAVDYASETANQVYRKAQSTAFDTAAWLESASTEAEHTVEEFGKHGKHGHCKKPNETIYELIAKSKYTTKLAALINEFPDLVVLLNGTLANYTVFAPTDKAFEKIPEGAPKPSKEELKKVLLYHVSGDFYPAAKVLITRTVPTLLEIPETLGIGPQRVSTNIGLKGLTVNFYSRIVAVNIFGTNGVIHGVDSLLIPPPKAAEIIQYLPGEFSTLELGLTKTGLLPLINDTSNHVGGTLFAPSNFAFQKLGPRINGFLFSKYGLKYLKALLKYHVVANRTLYSDAYYKSDTKDIEENGVPKGYFHIDLPTLLEDKSLSIDVGRYGRLIEIKINGFSTVTISDGIAADGVIHIVSNVLIPPKAVDRSVDLWDGESELSVEEFKERLEPFAVNAEL